MSLLNICLVTGAPSRHPCPRHARSHQHMPGPPKAPAVQCAQLIHVAEHDTHTKLRRSRCAQSERVGDLRWCGCTRGLEKQLEGQLKAGCGEWLGG